MEETITKTIVNYASKRMQHKEVAIAIHRSPKSLTRLCKKKFSCTYTQLRSRLTFSTILERLRDGTTTQDIANEIFDGNIHQLYSFVKNFSNIPPKQISIKGGRNMTAVEQQILETKVITMLAINPTKNLTLKQLGVPRFIIAELRKKGYNIISVPGRYNSGYNLNYTSKSNCLSWINNIRINRYGLPGNYSF